MLTARPVATIAVTSRIALQANKTLKQEQKNMKRIMISCIALAALAVPALAADPLVPKDIPNNGNFGNDRAPWAGVDPNFGASISARGGSNSIDNHLWMLDSNGQSTGNSLESLQKNKTVECTGLVGQIPGC